MPQSVERLEAMLVELRTLEARASGVLGDVRQTFDEASPGCLDRVARTAQALVAILQSQPPELVSGRFLDRLLPQVVEVASRIENPGDEALTAASEIDARIDDILDMFHPSPAAFMRDDPDIDERANDFLERLSSFRTQVSDQAATSAAKDQEIKDALETAAAGLREEVATIRDSISSERQRLDALTTQHQQQFSEAQQLQQQQFAQSQQQFLQQFTDFQDQRRQELDALKLELSAAAATTTKALQEGSTAELGAMRASVASIKEALDAENQRVLALTQTEQQQFTTQKISERETSKSSPTMRQQLLRIKRGMRRTKPKKHWTNCGRSSMKHNKSRMRSQPLGRRRHSVPMREASDQPRISGGGSPLARRSRPPFSRLSP
jgi:ABC-type transporter Mla subunit MlaD